MTPNAASGSHQPGVSQAPSAQQPRPLGDAAPPRDMAYAMPSPPPPPPPQKDVPTPSDPAGGTLK